MAIEVYDYVAFYVPKENQKSDDAFPTEPTILVEGRVLATSNEIAKSKVIRKIPVLYEDRLDQVEVRVRLFR